MLILEVLSAFHLLSLFCSMLDFLRQIGSKCRKSHPQTRQTILPYHLLPEPVIMGCSTVMIVPRVKMVFFFFKKQVDDIYTIIWLSWYLTYIDVLSICLTSEFSLYGKRNGVFFSFTIWSETKCKIYFNFYANYLHSVTDCKKKKGGGVLIGTYSKTLRALVPFDWPSPKLS